MFESDLGRELLKLPFILMPHHLGHLTHLIPGPEGDKCSHPSEGCLSRSDPAGDCHRVQLTALKGESQALPRDDCRSMLS